MFAAVYAAAYVGAQGLSVYALGWYDAKFGGRLGTFLFNVELGLLPGAACALVGYATGRYVRLSRRAPVAAPRLRLASAAAVLAPLGLLPAGALPLRRGAGDYAWYPLFFWFLGGGALLTALAGRLLIRAAGTRPGRVAA